MNDTLFYNSLIDELNELIENELSKSYEEIDAELIDECCLALESVYTLLNGEELSFENVVSLSSIVKKYKLQKRRRVAVSVACAAAVILIAGTANFSTDSEILAEGNVFKAAIGKLEELIKNERASVTESTTETEATQPDSAVTETTEATTVVNDVNTIQGIYIILPDGINRVYKSVGEIDLSSAIVGVNYSDGNTSSVNINECKVSISEPAEDGETKITVSYKGFKSAVYVTVLTEEKLNPKTLTSVYGIFENGYNVNEMTVYAVFSDGTEEEINKEKCKITSEEIVENDVINYLITVEYNECSFQFISEEKGVEQ